MPPLQRCLSLSVQPFWQASRKRSPIPTPSTLFGMRRSYGGEEFDILTFDGLFDAKFDILKPRWLPTQGKAFPFQGKSR